MPHHVLAHPLYLGMIPLTQRPLLGDSARRLRTTVCSSQSALWSHSFLALRTGMDPKQQAPRLFANLVVIYWLPLLICMYYFKPEDYKPYGKMEATPRHNAMLLVTDKFSKTVELAMASLISSFTTRFQGNLSGSILGR